MTKAMALALAVVSIASAAQAQQTSQQNVRGAATSTTPGVAAGTTGTTFSTPGAQQTTSTPGGTIPMAAGTQDIGNQPGGLRNYNNGGGVPNTRR
jgi:hypothetical protein